MTISEVCAVGTALVAAGGVLIYVGRSLGTLQSIGEAVNAALNKTDRHEQEITGVKERLAKVETRQEDCENCP